MFKLYMGYYYNNEGKRTKIIKIGQTVQTCYQRCKKEDYWICQAVELNIYDYSKVPKGLCDFLEAAMIFEYRNKYPTYKGNEYFELNNKSEYEIETEWCTILKNLIAKYTTLNEKDWVWHFGFVEPYTY